MYHSSFRNTALALGLFALGTSAYPAYTAGARVLRACAYGERTAGWFGAVAENDSKGAPVNRAAVLERLINAELKRRQEAKKPAPAPAAGKFDRAQFDKTKVK